GSVKAAVDIIIDALKGITTARDSEEILKQFRGKSPGYLRGLLQGIKARAGENDETPAGMITWLFGDLTNENRGELRQILIKANVLEDLTPILVEELVSDFGSILGASAEILDILTKFGGTGLDNILKLLAAAMKKNE